MLQGGINLILLVKVNAVTHRLTTAGEMDGKKIIITESTVRRDLQLEDAEGVDCLPNSTIFEQLTLIGSKTTAWNEFSNTMASAIICLATNQKFNFSKYIFENTIAQTRFENVSKLSNDPMLARILDLEKTKTIQAEEIVSLKRRVKKLEQKNRSRTHGLKRLYKVGLTARVESSRDEESLGEDSSKQGRINAIDVDEDITLVNDQDDADMFDVNTLTSDEVLAELEVAVKDVNLTVDEVTLAQALAALKSVKPKVKAIVVEKPSVPVSAASTKVSATTTTTTATIPTPRKGIGITELDTSTTTTISSQPSQAKVQDKGKGIMFDEEERLAREKDEANVALTEEWDDIQAKVDADYQLAQRLQAEEQEQFTTEQKATLFKELLEQRRKHFAAKRAEEKRNKPPTQAQQRKIMCTYLKNMEGKKPKDLKNKSFDSIQNIGRSVQEIAKVDNDQEAAKIKELIKTVPDKEEVAIDAIPLAIKPIVDWKIHKEWKKTYYQIIKADRSSKMYLVFSHMLKSFDMEDLETLWKLIKAKHGSTRPEEGNERRVLLGIPN
ncbi:hypothetical protein Tco_0818402 [Tanacetum coccineum]